MIPNDREAQKARILRLKPNAAQVFEDWATEYDAMAVSDPRFAAQWRQQAAERRATASWLRGEAA